MLALHARERLRAFPAAEQARHLLLQGIGVEISDHDQLPGLRAEELAVEFHQLLAGHRLGVRDALVDGFLVADVATRVGIQVLHEHIESQRVRLVALLLHASQHLGAQLLQLLRIEGRLAQHLGEQRDHGRQVFARGLDARVLAGPPRAEIDVGLEPVEFIRELLAGVLRGSAHEHGRGHCRGGAQSLEAALVAESQ